MTQKSSFERKPENVRNFSSKFVWDYENGFYWFSGAERIGKLIAQYEIYKKIVGLPGDVVECGVYKAASLIRLATFRSMLESDTSRRIYAFDAFGRFPRSGLTRQDDLDFVARFETAGGEGLSKKDVIKILEKKRLGSNVELIAGDVKKTIPSTLAKRPQLRIALLHLDLDAYEPTASSLSSLWDRVVPGGVVVLDDYNAVAGATIAVDEFLVKHAGIRLEKLPFAHVPAFFAKPA